MNKKPPKLGDFKSAVYSCHLDSDREVEELNAAYIESLSWQNHTVETTRVNHDHGRIRKVMSLYLSLCESGF